MITMSRPKSRCTFVHHLLIGWFALTSHMLFAQRHNFSVQDLWEWGTASDVRISPDGARVAYVETRNDRQADARFSHLRLATADGREDRALTSGAERDFSPRWNPAGDRIAYLSNRSGRMQV